MKPRKRVLLIFLASLIVVFGLFTRSGSPLIPKLIVIYGGDVLWATLIYLLLCIVFSAWRPLKLAVYALIFAFAVEFSQLYRADWINALRDTRIGALVLGRGFLTSDLVCYTICIVIPMLLDLKMRSEK